MKTMILAWIAAVGFLSVPAAEAQTSWNIDPAHSAAQFRIKHLMINNVSGSFDKMSGTIFFDGKDYASVQVNALIKTSSIDTREPKRDEHLRSADFFDADTYPDITFKSKRVQNITGSRFELTGDLTMRGVTKEVVLQVEASPVIKGMGGEKRIGVYATTRVDRQDFGIKWNRALDAGGVVVGNEVAITLDLELIQAP